MNHYPIKTSHSYSTETRVCDICKKEANSFIVCERMIVQHYYSCLDCSKQCPKCGEYVCGKSSCLGRCQECQQDVCYCCRNNAICWPCINKKDTGGCNMCGANNYGQCRDCGMKVCDNCSNTCSKGDGYWCNNGRCSHRCMAY